MTEEEKKKLLTLAGLAAVTTGGAAIGSGIFPGLLQKKPTTGSRLGWGVTGGTAALLATLALKHYMEENPDNPIAGGVKSASDMFRNLPYSITGSRPTKEKLMEMTPMGRAMYGVHDPGSNVAAATSWLVRQLKGAMPDVTGLFGYKSPGQLASEKRGDETKQETLGTAGSIADIARGLFNIGASGLAGFGAGSVAAENYRALNRMKDFASKLRESGISVDDLNLGTSDKLKLNKLLSRTESSGYYAPVKQWLKDIKSKWTAPFEGKLFGRKFSRIPQAEINPVLAGRQKSNFLKLFANNPKIKAYKDNNGFGLFSGWGKGATKLTHGQRVKAGVKGGLGSLATLAILGGIQNAIANKSYSDYVNNVMNTPAMEK